MMQFQAQAKSFTDAETMATAYLAQYYGNKKVEYPINPFQMLKDEGKDTECRRLEGMIAAKQQKDQPRTLRVKTLRRYDLLPQKRLASREEIDAYVEGLRNELISALRDSDVIQLN